MKRKYFFVVLFLILAIFLSGCSGGIVTPATDEAKVKSVVNEYYLALSTQNWSKAKSYCVYGSDIYYAVAQAEALVNNLYLYCNTITINTVIDIQNVSINGNYATVSGYTSYLLTGCGYFEADDKYSKFGLQKIGNNWKLYGTSEPSTPAIPSYWGKLYNSNDGNCTVTGEALDFYIDGVFNATINSGENLSIKLTAGEHIFRVLLTKTQEVFVSGYTFEITGENWWFRYGCDDGTYPKDIEYKNTEKDFNSSYSGYVR